MAAHGTSESLCIQCIQPRSTCALSSLQLFIVQYLEDGWREITERGDQFAVEPHVRKFTDIL